MSKSKDWQIPGSGAEIYESVFVPAMMEEWSIRAMDYANLQLEERVLDIACGTGTLTRRLPKSVGPNGQVVGLDISSEMLAVARKISLPPSDTTAIEWHEGNASAIPFHDASFDVVFCLFGFMYFTDQVAVLKDISRVLKPNGRLILMVWGSIDKCPGQLAMKESWERHFEAEEAALFNWQHSLSDPETVRSLVCKADFRHATIRTCMGVVHLPSPEHLVRSYGAMLSLEADEKTRVAVIDEVTASLESYVGATGLAYPIEAILATARK
ncbi:MAG: class I SAM-dependent methyltransferase [Anaerolineae bacterium]|nr:class I SAM-dependent methyltransferase [Anaerolineae bacterium]